MIQKLYSFIQNKCSHEGVDCTMMHEILLGGHLYSRILKEKLQTLLEMIQRVSIKKAEITPEFKMNHGKFHFFFLLYLNILLRVFTYIYIYILF